MSSKAMLFEYFRCAPFADTVRVHGKVGNGLLCGVGFAVPLCLPDNRRYLFLFRAGQLTPVSCGFPPRFFVCPFDNR